MGVVFGTYSWRRLRGTTEQKSTNTMPPKTRNGEGSSKGPSLLPTLSKKMPPPVPRQRRSRGRSGAASVEDFVTHSGSSSRGVTAPSCRDIPPLEQPQQSKQPGEAKRQHWLSHNLIIKPTPMATMTHSLRISGPKTLLSKRRTSSFVNSESSSRRRKRLRAHPPDAAMLLWLDGF